jgi:hypothetical protein
MTPTTALRGLADGLLACVTLGWRRPRPRARRREARDLIDLVRTGLEPTSLALAVTTAYRRWRIAAPDGLPAFEAELRGVLLREWRHRCRAAEIPVVAGPPAGMEPAAAGATRLVTPRAALDVDFADHPGVKSPAEQFGLQMDAALDDLVREAQIRGVTTVGEVDVHVERIAYRVEHFLHVLAYAVA